MPRGYRRIIVATCGWLVLGGAAPDSRDVTGKQSNAGAEIEGTLNSIAASLKEANEPKRENADCPKGTEDRKSDLCAQWKAADAAADSAYWTWATFAVTGVGLLLGAVTMAAAIAAAKYAKDAAREGKRSADAAHDTNNAYIASERAFLKVSGIAIRDDPKHARPGIELTIKNGGRGNANVTEISWQAAPGPVWDGNPRFSVYRAEFVKSDDVTTLAPLFGDELPETPFYIVGKVDYVTLVNSRFESYFSYKVSWLPEDEYGGGNTYHFERHPCAGLPQDT